MLEILFAILAGVLTVGAPCILPLLPILLGASIGQQNKTRPLFIALGFIVMFSLSGLLLSYIVTSLHIAPNTIRHIAVFALTAFAIFTLWSTPFEKLTLYLSGYINKASQIGTQAGTGNFGGFMLGIMLGLIWTPCAGPVLGSILTLIATQTELVKAAILLFAYSVGAGIPMIIIAYGGQIITTKVGYFSQYTRLLQQVFGLLILILAITIYFQYDILIEAKLLELFPFWNFANLNIFN